MPLLKFVSVKLCLALILGILFGFYFSIDLNFSLGVLFTYLILTGFAIKIQKRKGFPWFGSIALMTTVVLGFILTTVSLGEHVPTHYTNHDLNEKNQWHLKITEVLKPTTFSERYFAEILSFENGQKVTGSLALSIQKDKNLTNFEVDDELIYYGNIETILSPLNPYQFDYKAFLRKKGVYHQIKASADEFIKTENPSKTVFGLAHGFRENLISKLKKYNFGEEELSIMQALLLGKRSDISEATYNDYKNAGAVHILAVSGLHVGILLLILQFLLKPLERLPKGKNLKLLVIIALLWTFAFIAGLSPSIIRAVTMFSFLAYAMHLNRPTNTFNILALSMFFILLFKPLFLFEVGFQMSYAAVFAIVWIHPKLQRLWYPKNFFVRKGWQLLSVSVAAQLGVLPISLFYFHQFPALFFISNLVVVPFLGIILGGGIVILFLASLGWLPAFLVTSYNFLINTMNYVIHWVAQQEAFVFKDISFDGIQLILGYFAIFTMIAAFQRPKFKNLALLLIGIILLQVWTILSLKNTQRTEQLLLAHQTANIVVLHQNGSLLQVMTSDESSAKRIVDDYRVGVGIDSVYYSTLKNSYAANGKSFAMIDRIGVLPPQKQIEHLVLTQSPKINLERVLDSVEPKSVIADGSNYKSYVARWEATCKKRKLPFHYTGEKGAYYFDKE